MVEFNKNHIIKDQFSEVKNQQQNYVVLGAIQWLKSASYVLLNNTDALEFSWVLASQYLAGIHNITWNNERKCIPLTARDGHTQHDFSKFL